MSENLHDIEDFFYDPIEGYQEMPPESVWESLDHKLDKSIVAITSKKYSRLKRLSAVLLLLLLGTIAYEVFTKTVHPVNKKYIVINGKNKIEPVVPAVSGQQHLLRNDDTKETTYSPNPVPSNSRDKSSYVSETAKLLPGAKDDRRSVYPVNNARLNRKKILSQTRVTGKVDAPGNNSAIKNYALKVPDDAIWNRNNSVSKKQVINISNAKGKAQPGKMELVNAGAKAIRNKKLQPVSDMLQTVSAKVVVEETNTKDEHKIGKEFVSTRAESKPQLSRLVTVPAVTHYNMHFDVTMNEAGRSIIESNTRIAPISVAKKQGHFHFALTPFFSPQFNFNHIVDNDDHPGNGQRHNNLDDIKNGENDKSSYSLGVLMEIPIKKRWFLQTGLAYINKTVEIEPRKVYANLDNGAVKYRFDFSSGYTYLSPNTGVAASVGDSALATGSSSNLQYIGIPLTVNYTFFKGKFNIVPSVGAGVNFLIGEKMQTSILTGTSNNKQNSTSIQGIKKVYFNTITGIAIQYNVGKKISVNLTPSANFALGPINRSTPVKSYPNSFNITAGVKIYF